jgi:hypothetical protein
MSVNNLGTFLNIKDSHLRVVSGNVYAQGINIGGITVDVAHGLQSITNQGNVTTNTLQFDNATTAFTTTANATVGRDLTVTGNATVSSNLTVTGNAVVSDDLTVTGNAIISDDLTVTGNTFYTNPAAVLVDSNVVTEYTGPHDRPLRKYPEVAMTSASQSGYIVTPSTQNGSSVAAYYMFDGDRSTRWRPNANNDVYDISSPFLYNGSRSSSISDTSGTTHDGVFLKLELPKAIKLDYTVIRENSSPVGGTPGKITFLGSTNGTDWTFLKEFSGMSSTALDETYAINETNYYNHFAFVVKNLSDARGELDLGEWELYGHEEGSGSLDTTLKSVYNVPATTGTQLEVYYDGQDFSGTPTSITDRSPNTITATANNITIDTTYKSFEITSSPRSNIIADNVTFVSGDEAHTYALWVRLKNIQQRNLLIDYRPDGGTSTTGNAAGILIYNYNQRIQFYHQAADIETPYTFTTNVWYHIICSYSAGGNNTTNSKIYINGVEQTNTYVPSGSSTSTLTLPTTGKLTIGDYLYGGSYSMGDGNIGNVRLYSKALNADQVKELYDYQKDYFLGSKSQVTLYKGHLGVGVTEPSGQLELAGDERIQEYPPRAITVLNYHTHIEGHGEFEFYSSQGTWTSNYLGSASWDFTQAFTPRFTTSGGWHGDSTTSAPGTYQAVLQYAPAVTSGDGVVQSTLKDGSTVFGEWIEMRSPYAINVTKLATAPRTSYGSSRGIGKFAILGSNNGIDWEYAGNGVIAPYDTSSSMDAGGYGTYGSETIAHVSTNSNGHYYTYHRLVVTHIMGHRGASGHPRYTSASQIEMVNQSYIRFYGTPGPTTLDKGSLSLTRSLDVPRVSRYDVDTETPRPEKLVVDFDTTVNSSPTDISGKGNHGAFYNGAYYSAADKAFVLDGTDDYIETAPLGFSGDQVYSISLWFWSDKPQTDMTTEHGLYGLPGSSSNPTARHGLSWWSPVTKPLSALRFWHSGSSGKNFPGGRFVQNTWNHIMVVYPGGGAFNVRIWLNGVEQQGNDGGSTNNNFAWNTSDNIMIGDWYSAGVPYGESPWDGKISNFKLYNVALEPSEVQKLYRLGRTGRSMVISDTAVGIGKVPEAQLDVRGNLNVDGVIKSNSPAFSAYEYDSYTATAAGYVTLGNTFVNKGGCYDTSNGIFTAPISGTYRFTVDATLRSNGVPAGSGYTTITLYINNANWNPTSTSRPLIYQAIDPGTDHQHVSGSLVWNLNAGDTVRIYCIGVASGTDINWGQGYGRFMGYLIS